MPPDKPIKTANNQSWVTRERPASAGLRASSFGAATPAGAAADGAVLVIYRKYVAVFPYSAYRSCSHSRNSA